MKDFLIGAQLKSINEDGFVVTKDGTDCFFEFHTDDGDCCGWANIEDTLLISEEELDKNPIITKVEIEDNDYVWNDYVFGDKVKVTLFGESKPLYEINSEASSGSGWQYGACAWIECRLVKITETLANW